ncbi:MAG: radical SAM protein [Firmicutes bacterium]|nr:radical SAM protein [Bacillota bacterium]
MHYTLHLTADCNLKCDYCYVKRGEVGMKKEVALCVIDNAIAAGQKKTGVAFFGGEPLLHKDLIRDTVAYARKASEGTECKFFFKLTTNGVLLDEEFIRFCKRENIFTAISLDGHEAAHNAHRKDLGGKGSYERVAAHAKLLLKRMPNSPVMMTVNPDTVKYYAESVEHLHNLGFFYILCGINYAAKWREADLKELARQYKKLAEFYYAAMMAEKKLYLSPFEMKIYSHVHNRTYCGERCELSKNQISVGPDGSVYPCIEFVGDPVYKIGDIHSGVDPAAQQKLFLENRKEKTACEACAIRIRCNHYCACQNKRATGSIDEVSPVLCRHEQILLPIADKLAERLYKKRSALFIQKHYNDYYPILAMMEEKA